ncbi:MAG TPA: ParB/RepB/Spo0J family partition protein [Candidatus Omnitrophota bacterium]|nr:ParB/RepB/Spo0J family partition protein [Candidatus Omnitrophota bacterium]
MDRKVLGRGLEALIPADTQGVKERVQMLKVSQVKASRFQPRLYFPQSRIEELANSIREKGVIQPVLVRSIDGDNYELIAGERRLRAAKHLGLIEIPAIVRRVADADLLEMSIIENIQREELNAVEEAKAYQRLAQEFGLSQDLIAQRVGKDKSSISNLLRLLNLSQKIQDYITQNFITFGHAKALLSLVDPKNQESFADQIIAQNLSVRQAELLVSQRGLRKRSAKRNAVRNVDQDTLALEEKLQHILGTKVRIQHKKKRGKIEIEYYSLEDLDRVLALLGVK